MFLQKYIKKIKDLKKEFEDKLKDFEHELQNKKDNLEIFYAIWRNGLQENHLNYVNDLEKKKQTLIVDIAKFEAALDEKKVRQAYELATAQLETSKAINELKLEKDKNAAIIANYMLLLENAKAENARLTTNALNEAATLSKIATEAVKATSIPKIDIVKAAA